MECTSISLPYQQIGHFSNIIVDYLNRSPDLRPFYKHPVSLEGIQEAIKERKAFATDRKQLTQALQNQYAGLSFSARVKDNIEALNQEDTFTVVTAHQPNIFTGYLYFFYKILHAIKLADWLSQELPQHRFVPVFYMGAEDADLEELSKIFLKGEKIVWETDQRGAVGRMRTGGLDKILARIEGELVVHQYGRELMWLLKETYLESPDIQTATLKLINALFGAYGLVVLIPDQPGLKKLMHDVFENDLLRQRPSEIVEQTIQSLQQHYKAQANPRAINLFYLKDDTRERIVKNGNEWRVTGTDIRFSEAKLMEELQAHPERFSPNVILRGLFQETILPNIAFIGGGGETAYWLELKDLFAHYDVPFPVLILRNSFLFVEKKWKDKIERMNFAITDFFKEERLLLEDLVKRDSGLQLRLDHELNDMVSFYAHVRDVAGKTDASLQQHVEALRARAVDRMKGLEKKMLRAEKRKFADRKRQIHAIKQALFPQDSLQERIDNFMPYYAKYGQEFIKMLYDYSPLLEQHFVVVVESE